MKRGDRKETMVFRVVRVSVVMVCLLKNFKGEFFEVVAGHTNIVTPGSYTTLDDTFRSGCSVRKWIPFPLTFKCRRKQVRQGRHHSLLDVHVGRILG